MRGFNFVPIWSDLVLIFLSGDRRPLVVYLFSPFSIHLCSSSNWISLNSIGIFIAGFWGSKCYLPCVDRHTIVLVTAKYRRVKIGTHSVDNITPQAHLKKENGKNETSKSSTTDNIMTR